jgi:hypothetical protein
VQTKIKTIVISFIILFSQIACNQNTGTGTRTPSSNSTVTSSSSSSTFSYSGINAVQIIAKTGSNGSFDSVVPPPSGGLSVYASRYFNLDGSIISTSQVPTWLAQASLFITSTRTSPGSPSFTNADTACAYFDSYIGDNNPESDGYYTIDGYNTSSGADIDQCAGTQSSETSKLGLYIKLDRNFMNPTDKIQIIVKAKPIDAPNTAPSPSSCVVGGNFDPQNCVNTYFTVSMRTAPFASSQPFYVLFPSAKAYDLLSESVLLPIQIDPSVTTISIDRIKGGAIFYGVTIIRLL